MSEAEGTNPQGGSFLRAAAPASPRQSFPVQTDGKEKARTTKTKGSLTKSKVGRARGERNKLELAELPEPGACRPAAQTL